MNVRAAVLGLLVVVCCAPRALAQETVDPSLSRADLAAILDHASSQAQDKIERDRDVEREARQRMDSNGHRIASSYPTQLDDEDVLNTASISYIDQDGQEILIGYAPIKPEVAAKPTARTILEFALSALIQSEFNLPQSIAEREAERLLDFLERFGRPPADPFETQLNEFAQGNIAMIVDPIDMSILDQQERERLESLLPVFTGCCAVGSTRYGCEPWLDICWCCSGILVAPNVVLIAEHCFMDDCLDRTELSGDDTSRELWVYFGQGAGEEGLKVRCVEYHRFASDDGRPFDVAALVLASPVVAFSDVGRLVPVDPVILAGSDHINDAADVFIGGFGISNGDVVGQKRIGRVAIASNRCGAGPESSGEIDRYGCHGEHELVASAIIGALLRTDSCKGDSGGPAFIEVEGELRLAGITSRSVTREVTDPICGKGGIYVRVDDPDLLRWLDDVVEGCAWRLYE